MSASRNHPQASARPANPVLNQDKISEQVSRIKSTEDSNREKIDKIDTIYSAVENQRDKLSRLRESTDEFKSCVPKFKDLERDVEEERVDLERMKEDTDRIQEEHEELGRYLEEKEKKRQDIAQLQHDMRQAEKEMEELRTLFEKKDRTQRRRNNVMLNRVANIENQHHTTEKRERPKGQESLDSRGTERRLSDTSRGPGHPTPKPRGTKKSR